MHADVKNCDLIWTAAYVQRGLGYMIWDTLFAIDAEYNAKPQMVDEYKVTPTS
jgi:peptide/nickel transport system substrate-binding protein